MGVPTIAVHSELGSDTQASGAGPGTAQFGTKARNKNASVTKVGFYESTPPDLSEINVDGTHAVWWGSGSRRFTKVTAKKDTQESTTGNISAGAAVLSALGSTTGMAVGDPISVAAVGPSSATLYSTILTVDSGTQVTLTQNASYSGTGKTVVCPKNVTVEDAVSLTADTTWAIGGYRKRLDAMTTLPADMKAGWEMQVHWVTDPGTDYTLAAVMNFTVAGDTTTGRIKIRGISAPGDAMKRPVVKGTGTTIDLIDIQQPLYEIEGIEFNTYDECIRYSTANAADLIVRNCLFDTATGPGTASIRVISTATGGRLHVRDCTFKHDGTAVWISGSVGAVVVENCLFIGITFHGMGSPIINENTSSPGLIAVQYCRFRNCADCVWFGTSSTAGLRIVEHCSVYDCESGVTAGHVAQCRNMLVRNNVFVSIVGGSNYGIDLPANCAMAFSMVDYNTFAGCDNPRGPNTPAGLSDSNGALGSEVDPEFVDVVNDDWRTGPNASHNVPIWPSNGTVGWYQRRGPIRSFDMQARITTIDDMGTHYVVHYRYLGGTALPAALKGLGEILVIPKDQIPAASTPYLEVARHEILQFLRNNDAVFALGEEILI